MKHLNHLYLKLLWFLADLADVQALDLYKNGYGTIEFTYRDKKYKLSLYEQEDETNGN